MNDIIKNSVCCVIVTYNIGNDFLKCFNAINGQTEKIIIVDNGSNKETLDVLNTLDKLDHVEVIFNNENMGIAFALNLGVKYAAAHNYKWILTMDNDSMATPGMVSNMLKLYDTLTPDEQEKIVSLFPKYIEESTLTDSDLNSLSAKDRITFNYVEAEITSGNLIKSHIFSEIGFFLDQFFIDYVDLEFCLRLSNFGYKMIQLNQVFLIHNLGNTQKANIIVKSASYTNHNPLRRYYMTRNRIYVWKKYFNSHRHFVLKDIYSCFSEMAKILLFEKSKKEKLSMFFKGIKDAFKGRYGKY